MAIEKIIIENRKLTVYERDLNNSQSVVYNNKIYRWFSKSGHGINFCIGLEHYETKDQIYVKGENIKKMKWILQWNWD